MLYISKLKTTTYLIKGFVLYKILKMDKNSGLGCIDSYGSVSLHLIKCALSKKGQQGGYNK